MGDKETLIAMPIEVPTCFATSQFRLFIDGVQYRTASKYSNVLPDLIIRADRTRADHDSQTLQNQLLVKYIANLMQATGAAGQTIGGGVGTGQGSHPMPTGTQRAGLRYPSGVRMRLGTARSRGRRARIGRGGKGGETSLDWGTRLRYGGFRVADERIPESSDDEELKEDEESGSEVDGDELERETMETDEEGAVSDDLDTSDECTSEHESDSSSEPAPTETRDNSPRGISRRRPRRILTIIPPPTGGVGSVRARRHPFSSQSAESLTANLLNNATSQRRTRQSKRHPAPSRHQSDSDEVDRIIPVRRPPKKQLGRREQLAKASPTTSKQTRKQAQESRAKARRFISPSGTQASLHPPRRRYPGWAYVPISDATESPGSQSEESLQHPSSLLPARTRGRRRKADDVEANDIRVDTALDAMNPSVIRRYRTRSQNSPIKGARRRNGQPGTFTVTGEAGDDPSSSPSVSPATTPSPPRQKGRNLRGLVGSSLGEILSPAKRLSRPAPEAGNTIKRREPSSAVVAENDEQGVEQRNLTVVQKVAEEEPRVRKRKQRAGTPLLRAALTDEVHTAEKNVPSTTTRVTGHSHSMVPPSPAPKRRGRSGAMISADIHDEAEAPSVSHQISAIAEAFQTVADDRTAARATGRGNAMREVVASDQAPQAEEMGDSLQKPHRTYKRVVSSSVAPPPPLPDPWQEFPPRHIPDGWSRPKRKGKQTTELKEGERYMVWLRGQQVPAEVIETRRVRLAQTSQGTSSSSLPSADGPPEKKRKTVRGVEAAVEVQECYVHFDGHDRRLDDWIRIDRVVDFKPLPPVRHVFPHPAGDAEGELELPPAVADSEGGQVEFVSEALPGFGDPTDLTLADPRLLSIERERAEITRVKNVSVVQFGRHECAAWYFSPYPEEDGYRCGTDAGDGIVGGKLWVCEFCIKYFKGQAVWAKHRAHCSFKHPPGEVVYKNGNIKIYEIDGRADKLYCQNLCLFGKLFIDHKTVYYDMEPFLFYVLTETDKHRRGEVDHVLGYFSKEKESVDGYNLACIVTLPHQQRKGYGRLLIEFSYELSKVQNIPGTPERPLSDLGLLSYRTYWQSILLHEIESLIEEPSFSAMSLRSSSGYNTVSTSPITQQVSLTELSDKTGMKHEDVVSTLQGMGFLKFWKVEGKAIVITKEMVDTFKQENPKVRYEKRIDPTGLIWWSDEENEFA
ncbi:hypothetical protein HDU93_003221 [Gonapodya sp. JEL0774]|nr:hypothetical protein HDU93_003221 [Gonapodya sp. JEL0774]